MNTILQMAACAFQAYEEFPPSSSLLHVVDFDELDGFGVCRWWSLVQCASSGLRVVAFVNSERTHTQVVVFVNFTKIVVAFRGTETDQLTDVLTDVRMTLTPIDDTMAAGGVHTGFWQAWQSVREGVVEAIDKFGDGRELFVTGHSLGAALATLCAFDITPTRTANLVTFGSPRVGNREFARAFASRCARHRCHRVHTRGDVVTYLPPSGGKLAYSHVPCTVVEVHDGTVSCRTDDDADDDVNDDRLDLKESILQHLEPSYFDQLTRAFHLKPGVDACT